MISYTRFNDGLDNAREFARESHDEMVYYSDDCDSVDECLSDQLYEEFELEPQQIEDVIRTMWS